MPSTSSQSYSISLLATTIKRFVAGPMYCYELNLASQPYGLSFWFGTALIVAGVLVNVVSTWNHIRLIHALSRGEFSTRPSRLAIAVALLLAVLGLAMAAYLLSVHEPSK
jgi:uncharacterized membrane protein YidH (DUF202 family)